MIEAAEKPKIKIDEVKPKERLVKMRFRNLEQAGLDLAFTVEGKRYHFLDGGTYIVPKSIVDHLNSLGYPQYEEPKEQEFSTGEPQPLKVVRWINRFHCEILE